MTHGVGIIEYGAWGERFFAAAVSEERVLAGVNVLAGRPIDVGPLGVGPGRIAKVYAQGTIGTATGYRLGDRPVSFQVTLPVGLEFTIDLGMDKQRYTAEMTVPLVITARARSDLAIVLDVEPPTARQVTVKLQAHGLRASLTQRAAGIDGELCRFVAKYVAREIDKPKIAEARVIDVAAALEKAAKSVTPKEQTGARLTEDLPVALETEIREKADIFLGTEGGTAPPV